MEADIDPADDPNNQGEDEFEEAEQQVHEEEEDEETVPTRHADTHLIKGNQQQAPADEQLVVSPIQRGGKSWILSDSIFLLKITPARINNPHFILIHIFSCLI